MAYDFPASPILGQSYFPAAGGPSYAWDGTAWRMTSGGVNSGVFIGDTPPPNPVHGQLWWESDTGNTFIYYQDANSGQWVQFNVASDPEIDHLSSVNHDLYAGLSASTFRVNDKADGTGDDIMRMTEVGTLAIYSRDDTAAAMPYLQLHRLSPSPAANDSIGGVNFYGNDSTGALHLYARILSAILDPVNGSEDGNLALGVSVAGTFANRLVLDAGGADVTGDVQASGKLIAGNDANCYLFSDGTTKVFQVGTVAALQYNATGNTWNFTNSPNISGINGLTAANISATVNIAATGTVTAGTSLHAGTSVNGASLTVTGNSNANVHVGAAGAWFVTNGTFSASPAGDYRYLQFNGANWSIRHTLSTGEFMFLRNGAAWMYLRGSDGVMIHGFQAFKPGGGPWADSSDSRIKNVIGDYESGLDEIKALRPVRYTFKGNETDGEAANDIPGLESEEDGEEKTEPTVPYKNSPHYEAATAGTEYVGLIAQEVEQVMPGMVKQREAYIDGQPVTDLRDLDTGPLIFALINAVKELTAKVEALEAAR